MPDIKSLLVDYLNYLEVEKNYSPKTRENYGRYLSLFLKKTNAKNPKDLSLSSIQDFRLFLARQKNKKGEPFKKSTQSYYIIALRNFIRYLRTHDIHGIAVEKIELPKTPMRQIDIIHYEDMERLLRAPEGRTDIRSLRDHAILETLFSTGLRISELCSLDRYIDLHRGEISVRGKGNKLRVVFLSENAKHLIKKYLEKRGDPDPALFVSIGKAKVPKILGRITPRAIQRLLITWAKKAGIDRRVTPHQLRHQFATDLLMNGADLRSVQELLGHQNISTTQVYTHVTNKALREIHTTFHGRRRKNPRT